MPAHLTVGAVTRSSADATWLVELRLLQPDGSSRLWDVLTADERTARALLKAREAAAAGGAPPRPYGLCPLCGAPGVARQRRPDGADACANHHVYPSAAARYEA